MPELPEVEHLRRTLLPILVGVGVESVTVRRRGVALAADARGHTHPARPRDLLQGARIASLDRHGKQLAIAAADGRVLVARLGMTGSLRLAEAAHEPDTHVHVFWMLSDGRRLIFRDPRRFGGLLALAGREALARHWAPLGVDALRIRGDDLRRRIGRGRRAVKSALLDQRALAGVGNIYADEALFGAGICPLRPCNGLSGPEWARVAAAVRTVLRRAIRAGGSTLRDYVDGIGRPGGFVREHAVYGRAGRPCLRCEGTLARSTVGQRTTVWCPCCQPPGSGEGVLSTRRTELRVRHGTRAAGGAKHAHSSSRE